MDGPFLMDLGPPYSRQDLLRIFLVPEVSTQTLLACMALKPQTLWEAFLAVWTKFPEARFGRVMSPRARPQAWQPERQKCQLWSLLFLANTPEMLQEWWRKQSHWDHFYREQGIYYDSGLRGDNFSKPWALNCVRWSVNYLESLPFTTPYCPTF
jgi:hypothetical protein